VRRAAQALAVAAGVRCPKCSSTQQYLAGQSARKLYQCGGCRLRTSLTVSTLREHTKLPLTTWFLAIHLISQAKTGISALVLTRDLGVSYPAAWLLHNKINGAMSRQEATRLLHDAFEALKYLKYAQTYRGAFAYRFNHRFDLRDTISNLIVGIARAKQTAKRVTRRGHAEINSCHVFRSSVGRRRSIPIINGPTIRANIII
jgi:hypothetical protein